MTVVCLAVSAGAEASGAGDGKDGGAPSWMEDFASRMKVYGYAQAGFSYAHGGGADASSFDLKRSLLWVDGEITNRWSFRFMHDFSSVVQEYFADYRITRSKALTVRFGQFKNAFSYENPLSPTSMETIDVYSEGVTYLSGCGSDPLMGVQYGRDLGVALLGETSDGRLRYELNVLNGQGINCKDLNAEKDFIGRLEWRPATGLSIVATGQIGRGHSVAPSVYNPDIKVGQNYRRNRWSAGFDYKSRALNVHGEYLEGKDGEVVSRGAYITGSVPLVAGKFDLVGSYDFFNFNTSLGMDQHKAVAGFQYWFYKKCRLQMQYVYKSASVREGVFRHGANNALMCQLQVRFN